MYNNAFLIRLILLLFNINISSQKYVKYPFKRLKPQSNKPLVETILQNDLEITIEIGTPPQKINLNLRSQYYTFFVSGSKVNYPIKKFNENESNTCKILNDTLSSYLGQEYSKGYKISETIKINGKKINNITLILASEINYIESGNIGLRPIESGYTLGDFNFIYQIKKSANFDNYSFSLNYLDDDNGELIIGTYPHNYDKRYNEKNLIFHKIGIYRDGLYWLFNVNNIKYGNSTLINYDYKCLINIEFGLISAPGSMRSYFLDSYLSKNKCNPLVVNNIIFYFCPEDNIKNFKDLVFYSKEFNYEFVFTYKDLFIKDNDKYIFGIVFYDNVLQYNSVWIFGHLFLKKYFLTFDLDKRIIGLYNKIEKSIFNWGLVFDVVLIVLILLLSLYIIFHLKKPRKIRANELQEDNYEYISALDKNTFNTT